MILLQNPILCNSVPKIGLGEQCFHNDICEDPYAVCQGGVCACPPTSPEKDGECSKLTTIYMLYMHQ